MKLADCWVCCEIIGSLARNTSLQLCYGKFAGIKMYRGIQFTFVNLL